MNTFEFFNIIVVTKSVQFETFQSAACFLVDLVLFLCPVRDRVAGTAGNSRYCVKGNTLIISWTLLPLYSIQRCLSMNQEITLISLLNQQLQYYEYQFPHKHVEILQNSCHTIVVIQRMNSIPLLLNLYIVSS
ncbi:Hypothetical_protein [Hexamita inflata]|uniref:Hypothetical_protein n=1 Tax=Hexamita inflata TaxID=28002 RepID=A0AA86NPA8_9EUKA|nr:Hypothetical protein HINF_LOCUS9980 [Hexamita inflata]